MAGPAAKKKHICGTCDRAFTTSGHLARHSRVHTGERNHKCPFPGCEMRCSRHDNLQQHYRIHLSSASRRSSTRSGASSSKKASNPPSTSPALESTRTCSLQSSARDSPQPLAQASLPASATLPLVNSRIYAASDLSYASEPPEALYISPDQPLVPMALQSQGMLGRNSQNYSYHSGTTTYQEQSQGGAALTYVFTAPVSNNSNRNSFSSYSSSHDNFGGGHSVHHSGQNRSHSPI